MGRTAKKRHAGKDKRTPSKKQESPPRRQKGLKVGVLFAVLGTVALLAYVLVKTPAIDISPEQVSPTALLTDEPLHAVPGDLNDRFKEKDLQVAQKKYPSGDDWDVEVFNVQVGSQLKAIGHWIQHPHDSDNLPLADLATSNYQGPRLQPDKLQTIRVDSACTVKRWSLPADQNGTSPPTFSGLKGLKSSLDQMAACWEGASEAHCYFKTVHVGLDGATAESEVYFDAWGIVDDRSFQQKATWTCRWQIANPESKPKLASILVKEHTEVLGPESGGTLFDDCTQAILGGNESFTSELLPGLDHWRARVAKSLGLGFTGHQGLAVGDVNGDGLDDLYVCQPGGLPNRLYVQNGDGSASDVSTKAGVDVMDMTWSALFLDLDRDQDQDLALSTAQDVFFLIRDASGVYRPSSVTRVPYALSISAADFDNDTDLDIYVCSYSDPDLQNSNPVPYHDANNGRRNVILRNEGMGKFVDVTDEVGLNQNNRRFSFAGSWEDFDNDGDPDLYVTNDFGRNNLYRNDGGKFVDIAGEAGVEDISAGMGVSWGDYNNDGWMDLYVSNMFSSAGNRITFQRRFKGETDESVRAQFQRHARGNSLFENNGDGTFTDVSVEAGVTMGRWAWGSKFVDFNNDGLEDIAVTNGFVTNEDTKDL